MMFIALMFSLLVGSNRALGENQIVFSYIKANVEPFAIMKEDVLVDGILKEIGEAVAGALGKTAAFRLSSRNRIERDISSGVIHVNCFLHPSWVKDPKQFEWTKHTAFEDSNVLVMRKDDKRDFKQMSDLKGANVGANLGFFYPPKYMEGFKQNTFIRHDVKRTEQNYAKLLAKRVDTFIDSEIGYRWYVKKEKTGDKFKLDAMKVNEKELFCAVSKQSPVRAEKIDATLADLHAKGQIEKILARYR